MSAIEVPLPPAEKLQPLQKWYMLFPANWAELAFDRTWRTKRLDALAANQGMQYFVFWGTLGIACFMYFLNVAHNWNTSPSNQDLRSSIGRITLLIMLVCLTIAQSVKFLQAEIEKLLLQIIDRLEREGIQRGE